jgi:hypothetical protein
MKDNIVGYLLSEEVSDAVEFKIKSEDKSGFVLAEGVLQNGNAVNRNKRYYPTEELNRAIHSPRIVELMTTGNLMGEAGHPSDASLQRQAKIDPTNVQVWYKKIWMEGDLVKAHFTGTSNDLGRSFNEDLKRGQHPSFSLRALGSLVNEGGRMTVRNMQMITYDRVYFPSHSKAYTTKIVTTESVVAEPVKYNVYNIDPDDYYFSKAMEINKQAQKGNSPVMESTIQIPLTQSQISNYIVTESANVKLAMNTFDVLYESMKINPNMDLVTMKTKDGNTVELSLEQSVQKELINEINKLF